MSDIDKALISHLGSKAAVTAITTNISSDRIPQASSLPAITVSEFATTHEHLLNGNAAGIYRSRVRINCYASSRDVANQLGEAVRASLQGFRGSMGSEYVHTCSLDGRIKDMLQPVDASDNAKYRTQMSFVLVVAESVPTP